MAAQTFDILFQKWSFQPSTKSSSLLSLITFLILVFQLFMTSFSWQAQLCNLTTFAITISAFLTASKTQSWLYGLWCTILTSSAPLLIVMMTEEFFFCFLGYSFVCPLIILVLSDSQFYCLVSYCLQLVVVNFHLKPLLWENIQKISPEVFIEKMLEVLSVQLFEFIIAMIIVRHIKSSPIMDFSLGNNHKEEINSIYKKHISSFLFEIRDTMNSLHGSLQMISSKGLASDDKEMLKIAKVSTENIHRLFNNMTDSFSLDNSTPGIILNYTDSTFFFKGVWDVISVYIKRKYQEGSITLLGKIPKTIKIDVHRTKQLLMNLSEFFIHEKDNKKVDLQIEWMMKSNIQSVIEFEKDKILKPSFGFENLESSPVVDDFLEANHNILKKNIQESQGVLKLSVIGTGSSLTVDHLLDIVNYKSKFSEEVSKYNAELGLAAAAKIVQVLGGIITAESQEKQMTIFNIYLPSCCDLRDEFDSYFR